MEGQRRKERSKAGKSREAREKVVKEGGSTGGRINFPFSHGDSFLISQEDERSGITCFYKRFCY